jgi:hypothetical protein
MSGINLAVVGVVKHGGEEEATEAEDATEATALAIASA